MMKKYLFLFGILFISLNLFADIKVNKIDPSFWFTGMQNPKLQLLVYGNGIGNSTATADYPGVSLSNIVKLDSPNYLIVYLNIGKETKPGTINLTFTEGKKNIKLKYELKARDKKDSEHIGFDMSDALYLLMPDRFANGDPSNDNIKGMAPYKVDRNNPHARHGGDLAGIEQHLNYFRDLGITTLWFTPVLENNMDGGSYHGYATTDYYKIDPRLGTNQEYKNLIKKAHKQHIKIIMDMIFNHCGVNHEWIKDMPSKDWFNNSNYKKDFIQTSYKLTPEVDPYASKYDYNKMVDGWFVNTMPDLNQRNPEVYRYLVQTSIWWIEYADIDGIRMDTYPYADYDAMSHWAKEINDNYPNFNVVGETWVTKPAYTAWWQKDSKISAPLNSNLKTVMDFSFYDKMNLAKNEETYNSFSGLNRIYDNFVYDYLYPNPSSILAFLENHDTDRFLGNTQNFRLLKQAATLLLTTHRIPQLYYGTEIMMNGTKDKSDGYVRKDFPGGWPDDNQSSFTAKGRTEIQNKCYIFFRTLLNWRKNNKIISRGKMIQFLPQKGVYVYARSYKGKYVLVMLNGSDKDTVLPLKYYKEILQGKNKGKDILTGNTVRLKNELKMESRETLVIEL